MSGCESLSTLIDAQCGEPGVFARFACVHEHIREGVVCPSCEGKHVCRECWERADHSCKLFRIGAA